MRIKTAALWTLGMAVVLGLSLGVAYGARCCWLQRMMADPHALFASNTTSESNGTGSPASP